MSSNFISSPQGMGSLPRPAMEDGTLARWQSPRPDVTGSPTLLADAGPPPSRENDPWDTLANHLRVVLGSILAGIATPTEAAGIGAAGALLLAVPAIALA